MWPCDVIKMAPSHLVSNADPSRASAAFEDKVTVMVNVTLNNVISTLATPYPVHSLSASIQSMAVRSDVWEFFDKVGSSQAKCR